MKQYSKQQGFSLIETLFAIAILMIALVGPLTLAWSSISSSNDQRNEITATYLAQESLEYVRNVRDQYMVDESAYWSNLINRCVSGCDINPNESSRIEDCRDICQLYIKKVDDYLMYSSVNTGEKSQFSRSTKITKSNNRPEYFVTTKVEWKNHGRVRDITLTSVLYVE